ncbi:glucosaminidase domain-containing protein [Lacinutrix jangbogonensis]|uniref:glucosaminidase domain-containing protein n=1 Tax=Lacinutrix jangbogonensis TaxID=1469557 RepID=UPI00053DB60B|nr:glucosaminidase domain-containing protein [Lacinutrix jangbogonensis]
MNKLVTLLCVMFFVMSCGSSKKVAIKKEASKKETVNEVVIKEIPKVYNSPVEKYIAIYSDIAQDEMRNYDVPASITLAQGILESGSGKGRLAVEANNHFGIKCHKEWTGGRIYHDDDKDQECFRKYKNSKYSFRDHSLFLKERTRYAGLFKLDISDYKSWAKGLKAAGYATDRKYPQKLISLIERYQLYRFDNQVLGIAYNQKDKHTIVGGDTLYSLSRKYNISVLELKALNSLETNDLFVGQILFIKPIPKD